MNILDKNRPKLGGLLEKRYIAKILREEGDNIEEAIQHEMSTFSGQTKSGRSMDVLNTTLLYRHKKKHRFIDMKKRQTKAGIIRKKSYPIHNRVLYGHISEIIVRLKWGLTNHVVKQMQKMDGTAL